MTEAPTSLEALREAEAAYTRCPLYRDATRVVPGEGRVGAKLMMVGEQPGDQEDLAGRPFVHQLVPTGHGSASSRKSAIHAPATA